MLKSTEIPILDRYSTGSQLTKGNINTAFINAELVKKDELETEEWANQDVEIDYGLETDEEADYLDPTDELAFQE